MAGKRWLNIVVDGNIALQPYWHDIVSNYLKNIIRSFRGNLLEEAYLGLVLYNANTELVKDGFDMQFINWTKDANKFIEKLSCLSFKGNDANQSNMAEGLAEALVMYPKPSDIMPTSDYFNGERHCILVAAGDPIPKKMMLCLPMINAKGDIVGQRLMSREANFLDVLSHIFPRLQISVSVITPNSHPIFRAIYNLGNGSLLSNIPSPSYSNGQLTAFISKKFQYAHNALMQQNRPSANVASMNTIPTIPRVLTSNFQANNTSSLSGEVSIGERVGQASRIEPGSSSQPQNLQDIVFQNEVSPVDIAIASFDNSQTNEYDDVMKDILSGRDIFGPNKRSKTMVTLEMDNLAEQEDFFEQGESSTIIPIEALNALEIELEQVLKDGSNNNDSNVELISSSSKGVYIPASEVQTHTSSVLEEYSTRLLQSVPRNHIMYNPNMRSENCSGSSALPPPRVEQEYSTRMFQNIDNPSIYPTLEPQYQPPSVVENDSTTLHQDIRSNNIASNPVFISENSSSSSAPLVTQRHPPSVLNPSLNFQNPSSSAGFLHQQQTLSVGEDYSARLLHGKTSDNPMLISENSSNSGLIHQQNFLSLLPSKPQSLHHQHGLVRNPSQISTNVSYGEGTFSNTMGNSQLQFQPYSSQNQFPILSHQDGSRHGSTSTRPIGNFPENQYQSNNQIASYGTNKFNHQRNFLPVPAIEDLQYFVWEGILKGKIHPNRKFIIKTKVYMSPTTPIALISKWTNNLEILTFIPEKAVNDTKNIYNPIGYVFFYVGQFTNVNLYHYLKTSNLCGKVDLFFQSIVISPIDKENYCLGTIFDRGAVFVEQHYS